jgi:hypothetical protein
MKNSGRIAGLWAKILTQDLPNMMIGKLLDHSVQ